MGSLVYEVIERKGWREEAGARPNIEVFPKIDFLCRFNGSLISSVFRFSF